MKKRKRNWQWLMVGLSCASLSCATVEKNNDAGAGGLAAIEVESRLNSLVTVRASDYFGRVEYIPLETTDSSLVGDNPKVTLLPDKILLATVTQCLAFDRKSGKFLGRIGHTGIDPEGYRSADGWEKAGTGIIYFPGWKNDFLKYTVGGKFIGKTTYAAGDGFSALSVPFFNYLNRDTLLGYFPNVMGKEKKLMLFFSDTSDSLALIPNARQAPTFEIGDISVLKGETMGRLFGIPDENGMLLVNSPDKEKSNAVFLSLPSIWHVGNDTYFKEVCNDTIYRVSGTQLVPRYVFDTGAYRLAYEEQYDRNPESKKFAIPLVREGKRHLFFYFMFDKEAITGIFDKNTGSTVLTRTSEPMENDLNGLMPLRVRRAAPTGEFVGLELPADILAWLDEHPEKQASLPAGLLAWKQWKEDDNPVVVIMYPKE